MAGGAGGRTAAVTEEVLGIGGGGATVRILPAGGRRGSADVGACTGGRGGGGPG